MHACEIQNEVLIEMADIRTMEIIKEGKGDNMVASGGASRRTGFKGSVRVSTANPDCPIMKKEGHRKRMVENTVMKGTLANNKIHNRQLQG